MNEDDRYILESAAEEAIRDGWLAWELPEVIKAHARQRGIKLSEAALRQILSETKERQAL